MITTSLVRRLLDYDPETGIFRWKRTTSNVRKNSVAGTKDKNDYIRIQICGILYSAHRLAWLYVTGKWPVKEIDHKNRIRHDNRFDNLRNAGRKGNNRNRSVARNNNSGIAGVYFYKARNTWRARIKISGLSYCLGYYSTKDEAVAKRRIAELIFFGDFAPGISRN